MPKPMPHITNYLRHVRPRHLLLAALLAAVTAFRLSPALGAAYTSHIYPHISAALSAVSGLLPFAVGDLFVTASIAWVTLYPLCATACRRLDTRAALRRTGEYLLWVYAWFYAAWGINYSQPGIYRRTAMRPAKVQSGSFDSFARSYADSLNAAYAALDGTARAAAYSWHTDSRYRRQAMRHIRQAYDALPGGMGINRPAAAVQPKSMLLSPLCSMAGVTGSMAPFFAEFTINADVPPHDYPATCAHEYAHFLGIANEGEASFYSYAACTASADPMTRFSGYYSLLFHMLGTAQALLGDAGRTRLLRSIDPGIARMARRDRAYWTARRSRIVDSAQNMVYELYLRGNRVEGGRKSYSQVVALAMAWEQSRRQIPNNR